MNTKQVYLLGAGFTRAILGKIAPLADEIMPQLMISDFPEIFDDYERAFPNIEQFISLLDLRYLQFSKTNKTLESRFNNIRDNIVEQIVKFFDVESLHINNLDDCFFLKNFIEKIPAKSNILTLNYDCVLDQGLWLSNRWHPGGGYYTSSFPCSDDENKKKEDILLLKLHGSCNFRNSPEYKEYPKIEISDKIFSNISSHINTRDSSLDAGAHVLVMSYLKFYHNGIMQLWRKAIESLKDADKLIVIGCSLREEDTFLRFALYHFGMKKNLEKFSIDIIDKGIENSKNIEDKIRNLVAYPDKQDIHLFDGTDEYLGRENA